MVSDNMVILSNCKYVVRSQAGFRKAIKHLLKTHEDDTAVEGYPTQYPSVVHFTNEYKGYHYWYAHCIPLSKAIENTRNLLSKLLEIDTK